MMVKKTIAVVALTFCLIAALFVGCSKKQDQAKTDSQAKRELVVVSYGGAHQDAQRKAYFDAFSKKFNVNIKEETWSGDLGKLKAMVDGGNVTWDVVDVEAYMVLLGARQNLLEKLDYTKIPRDELFPEGVNEFGVVTCFWSTILGYSTKKYQGSTPHPSGWAEFWDVKLFPGPRALRKDPVANLEFALMASGVSKDSLYPLDIDKAFASLDKIKGKINVWWEAGEQPAQLLSSGEVALSTGWNGRIFNAQKDGKPVAIDWNEGLLSSDWWVIPRGAKNRDIAQDFIAFASSAEPQAEYSKLIPYGPVNRKALELLPSQILRDLPSAPENMKRQIVIDNQWWLDNKDAVLERWTKWLLQ